MIFEMRLHEFFFFLFRSKIRMSTRNYVVVVVSLSVPPFVLHSNYGDVPSACV